MNLLPILQNDTALLKRFHQNSFFFGPSQTQDTPSPFGALLSPDSAFASSSFFCVLIPFETRTFDLGF